MSREGRDMIENLRRTRPDVAIKLRLTPDPNYQWDGDGPDPVEDGFYAYDVDVIAMTIRDGKVLEGRESLGGSYFKPDENPGEVHGYLPQMVRGAIEELDKAILA